MIYSVFNYATKLFDYYEAPGQAPAVGKFQPPGGPINKPECLAVRLPIGARLVSSGGKLPRGCIAATDAGLGALEGNGAPGLGWLSVTALGLAAFWVGRRWRK